MLHRLNLNTTPFYRNLIFVLNLITLGIKQVNMRKEAKTVEERRLAQPTHGAVFFWDITLFGFHLCRG